MTNTLNTNTGSVNPYLDKRVAKYNSNLYPVRISVILKGHDQFRIGIKLSATKEMFEKAMYTKGIIPKEAKHLKEEIDSYMNKAKEILAMFPTATPKMFKNLFKSETALRVGGKTDMGMLFQNKIEELKEEDRAGSISFYCQALSAFKRFRKDFYLEDITEGWLKAFYAWWINQGGAKATAQIHFRQLRHIYNRAVKQGFISSGHYPFNDYKIGSGSKSKNVLYPEQIKKLWDYEPRTRGEKRSKDYFFLLYLSNGMNIKDALSIKGTQIMGDMISFVRCKTSNTSSETKEIMVYLHPESRRIIEKWGSLETKDYIFPCFRGSKTDIERNRLKKMFACNLNRDLKTVGRELGFEMPLILNLARHSYATRLKIDGIPVAFISDALGHSSGAVTAHYLKTLPDAQYKKVSESLLKFE